LHAEAGAGEWQASRGYLFELFVYSLTRKGCLKKRMELVKVHGEQECGTHDK
jgi:hypothetical protein